MINGEYVAGNKKIAGLFLGLSIFGILSYTAFAQTASSPAGYNTGAILDTLAPTSPLLSYPVASSTAVTLFWSISTDNVGVTGYNVYRNNVFIGTTQTISYVDSVGITVGTQYSYSVEAYDAAGNVSLRSASVLAGITDHFPPSIPVLSAPQVSTSTISISWAASTDNIGVVGYRVYRNAVAIGTTQTLSFVDSTGLTPGILYSYTVSAHDGAQNMSLQSVPVTAMVPVAVATPPTATLSDTTPPSVPVLYAPKVSSTSVSLYWSPSTDNVAVAGYNLYLNDVLVGSTQAPYYVDAITLAPATTYNYSVAAFDAAKNLSARSIPVSAIVPVTIATTIPNLDILPPSVPVLSTPQVGPSSISISWAASTDNIGVVGYRVYRNAVAIGTTQTLSFVDSTGLTPGILYSYTVSAHDGAQNMSLQSVPVTAMVPVVTSTATGTITTTIDTTPPVISLVRAKHIPVTGAEIRWVTDEPTVSYVSFGITSGVYSTSIKSNNCLAVTSPLEHCVILPALVVGAQYYYQVSAFNKSNLSTVSPEYSFIIPKPAVMTVPASTTTVTTTAVAKITTTTPVVPITTATNTVPAASTYINNPTLTNIALPVRPVTTIYAPLSPNPIYTLQKPNTSVIEAPVDTSVNTTVARPVALTVKPVIGLKSSSKRVVGKTEVFIKLPESVVDVEVHLAEQGGVATPTYLGLAQFDVVNARFVLPWDSTQTPDGTYRLIVSAPEHNGIIIQSSEVNLVVENEKIPQANTTSSNVSGIATTSGLIALAPRPVTEVQKIVDEIRKDQEQKESQIRSELTSVLGKYAVQGSVTSLEIDKIVAQKTEEVRDAVNAGDTAKKNEIINVLATAISGGTAPNEELKKEVEANIEKLSKVADEQKNGVIDDRKFSVDSIQVAEVSKKADGTDTAQKLAFHGKAIPNSFATLHIFSIPILVTVKTDSNGYWNYTLDKELEDGKHQVFVAITDVKGTVVSKSSPVPFVKVASAVTIEQASAATLGDQTTPVFEESNYLYGIVTTILFIIIAVLVFIGIKRSKDPTIM